MRNDMKSQAMRWRKLKTFRKSLKKPPIVSFGQYSWKDNKFDGVLVEKPISVYEYIIEGWLQQLRLGRFGCSQVF
jgi:hypothetical protein